MKCFRSVGGGGGGDLRQGLAKQKLSVRKLGCPVAPEFDSLPFKAARFLSASGTVKKPGQGRPSTRNTRRVPQIILQIGFPSHKFLQQLLVGFCSLAGLAGLSVIIGLGSQDIVGIAHGLDPVDRISLGIM